MGIIFGGLLGKCRILQLANINVAVMCTLASDFAFILHEMLVGMYGQRILQGVLLQQRYKSVLSWEIDNPHHALSLTILSRRCSLSLAKGSHDYVIAGLVYTQRIREAPPIRAYSKVRAGIPEHWLFNTFLPPNGGAFASCC